MLVLGISDMSADSSACLVEDGKVVAAVGEERVSLIKHCGGFPRGAIRDVLRIARRTPGDIDVVAVGNRRAGALMRISTHLAGMRGVSDAVPHGVSKTMALAGFTTYRRTLDALGPLRAADQRVSATILKRMLRREGIRAPVRFVDHHLSHAASTYLTSGFRDAAVITLDAYGDGRSGAIFVGENGDLEEIASIPFNCSLGEFYGLVTSLLGFRFGDGEGKTMALAPKGRPVLLHSWKRRVQVDGMTLKGDLTRWSRFTYGKLKREIRSGGIHEEDVAASAQALLESTVLDLARNVLDLTGKKKLCLAGGIFLNVKLNMLLSQSEWVDDLHMFPAPGDDGAAVGAALLVSEAGAHPPSRISTTALGPSFTQEEVQSSISRSGYALTTEAFDSTRVADEIANGALVGLFSGRMEFGPRALGHRSLLADPRDTASPARIRKVIKRRPSFQPFCPSMSPRFARGLLVNPKRLHASFMEIAFKTDARLAGDIPAVIHVDGTCRPQVVDSDHHRDYASLLQAFGRKTGIECLLNTSLNRSGVPIVRSPQDALRMFWETDMDLLVLGETTVSRKNS